jgi:hypothetical protein
MKAPQAARIDTAVGLPWHLAWARVWQLAVPLVAVVLLAAGSAAAQECETLGSAPDSLWQKRPASHRAFLPGEKLTFSVQYGLISAGSAVMSVAPQVRTRESRPTWEITTTARSSSVFSAVFEVNDRIVSYMDTLHLHSVRFQKHLREGNYRKDLRIVFDQDKHTATIDGQRTCEVEPHVQDILSSLYYVRTLDLEVGRSVYVPNHDNGKNYPLEILVHERERITVDAGTFDTLVLEPVILGESLFQQKGRMKVWVTDDDIKMPVLMKTKIIVGSIAAVLTEFELGAASTTRKPPAMVE